MAWRSDKRKNGREKKNVDFVFRENNFKEEKKDRISSFVSFFSPRLGQVCLQAQYVSTLPAATAAAMAGKPFMKIKIVEKHVLASIGEELTEKQIIRELRFFI